MAELRVLQTPRAVGNQWLVTAGLKPGDQVIMNNLQTRPSGRAGQSGARRSSAAAGDGLHRALSAAPLEGSLAMSRFFIDRPVFAWVIAILIMLAGALSITSLPIAQYPSIAPPTISVIATYPGASAKTLEDTVTQVIEQKLNGIDNLRYIESASTSDGTVTITVTFEGGTNPDIAQVQVQNKVALATPLLPQEVQQQGVQVNKSVRNFLIVVGLISEDGSMSGTDLADYNSSVMQDPISRLPGVGEIQTFGTQYAMRIWLDPDKLTKYQLATSDVIAAVRAQNAQVSAGALGDLPAMPGQLLNATIMAQSRLQTPEQFGAILLRVNPDGSRVFLRDVARVELGSETYNDARALQRQAGERHGHPARDRAPTRSRPWTR